MVIIGFLTFTSIYKRDTLIVSITFNIYIYRVINSLTFNLLSLIYALTRFKVLAILKLPSLTTLKVAFLEELLLTIIPRSGFC